MSQLTASRGAFRERKQSEEEGKADREEKYLEKRTCKEKRERKRGRVRGRERERVERERERVFPPAKSDWGSLSSHKGLPFLGTTTVNDVWQAHPYYWLSFTHTHSRGHTHTLTRDQIC